MANEPTSIETEAKEINTPAAIRYAEMKLIEADLESVEASLRIRGELQKKPSATDDDNLVSLALFRDAIVQFVACFDGKHGLDKRQVYGNADGLDEYFDWLFNVRTTFAAHRFGSLRKSAPGLLLSPVDGSPMALCSILFMFQGTTSEEDGQLIRLVKIARKYAADEAQKLTEQALLEIETWPAQKLAELPCLRTSAASDEERFSSRSQVRHRNQRPNKRRYLKRDDESR